MDESKLATFGEAWDIPSDRRYVGHEAMLENEDLDVVSVCTPSFLHHDHVLDAANSGAEPGVIWCEKPIASAMSDAERMVDACDETDTELVVNHSFRFTDKLRQLHSLIHEEGLFGEVSSVSTQYRMELMRNSRHVLDTLVYLLDARASQVSGYITGENEAIDGLVNNAGVQQAIPLLETTESEWDLHFDVNTKGAFIVSRVWTCVLCVVGSTFVH